MSGTARFSDDGVYRYRLERRLDGEGLSGSLLFIMLNPSTADAENDDPTIRRCIGYARRWNFRRLVVCNLFAFRATKPSDLKKAGSKAFGPENGWELRNAVLAADSVVAAWGAHGAWMNAGRNFLLGIRRFNIPIHALGLTKGGEPVHPLYQPADARLITL